MCLVSVCMNICVGFFLELCPCLAAHRGKAIAGNFKSDEKVFKTAVQSFQHHLTSYTMHSTQHKYHTILWYHCIWGTHTTQYCMRHSPMSQTALKGKVKTAGNMLFSNFLHSFLSSCFSTVCNDIKPPKTFMHNFSAFFLASLWKLFVSHSQGDLGQFMEE